MSVKLTMLGTGYATAMRCYNTCFLLQSADTLLMVDAGGGNGVLNQLERRRSFGEDSSSVFNPRTY